MKNEKRKRNKGRNTVPKPQTSSHGRTGRWILTGICVLAAIAAGLVLIPKGVGGLHLSINGLAVTEEEYRRMLNTQTYQVSKELSETYGLQSGGAFWEKDAGGVPAYQVLADRTVEALKQYRALYEIARERGYVEDISYTALLTRVENENKSRAEKLARGETVYGLSSFTVDLFLEYEADAIRTRYCGDPGSPGMDISEEELRAGYEARRETSFRRDDDLTVAYLAVDDVPASERARLAEKLDALADQPGSLFDLASGDPELSPYLFRREIGFADYRAASREIPAILSLTEGLAPGERATKTGGGGPLYLVECAARTGGGYTPYEEARDHLLKAMREEAFDRLVVRRAEAAAVTGDMERVYQFTKTAVQ